MSSNKDLEEGNIFAKLDGGWYIPKSICLGSLLKVFLKRHLEIPFIGYQGDIVEKKDLNWLEYPTVLQGMLIEDFETSHSSISLMVKKEDRIGDTLRKRSHTFRLEIEQIERGYVIDRKEHRYLFGS